VAIFDHSANVTMTHDLRAESGGMKNLALVLSDRSGHPKTIPGPGV